MNITNLTAGQLNKIITIKQKIEKLQSQIESIADDGYDFPIPMIATKALKKRRMSRAGRAKIAAAQKARWAKIKGTGSKAAKPAKKGKKKDWRSSPATKAKLSAAAKRRWAKVKAEGKTRL